jgi:Holliday junction resolvase
MTESTIKRKIVAYLKSNYYKVYSIQDRFTVGIPDIYAVKDGRSIWIEVKKDEAATRTKHASRQVYELADLAHHGVQAIMVWNLEQVKEVLQ